MGSFNKIKSQPTRISNDGIALIKRFEGCRTRAYQCNAGVWTIGYGHTRGVKPGDQISIEDAEKLLREDLVQFERGVSGLVETSLNQHQFDALVSFAFNVGVGALARSSLLKKINEGDYSGAAQEFGRWNIAGGVVLRGLILRREAERKLFISGI